MHLLCLRPPRGFRVALGLGCMFGLAFRALGFGFGVYGLGWRGHGKFRRGLARGALRSKVRFSSGVRVFLLAAILCVGLVGFSLASEELGLWGCGATPNPKDYTPNDSKP